MPAQEQLQPQAPSLGPRPSSPGVSAPDLGSNAARQEQLDAAIDLDSLMSMSMSERREALAAASAAEREALVQQAPEVIGPMDGAPVDMRYAANRLLVLDRIEDLEQERERGVAEVQALAESMAGVSWLPDLSPEELIEVVLEPLDEELERTQALTEAQLLVYEPGDDGAIVEVHGDLEEAQHVAVVLPGIGNDATNYGGWTRTSATVLLDEASALTEDEVATISFLYDAPAGVEVGLDWGLEVLKLGAGQGEADEVREGLGNLYDVATQATTQALADAGAQDLAGLMDGLGLDESVHTTAIGHSYGSLTLGQSIAEYGLEVDDAVFLGSPGLGVSGLDELLRRDDADPSNDSQTETWTARAAFDYVALGTDLAPLYGPQPHTYTDHDIQTGGILGHGGYMDAGTESLANVARIVADQDEQVTEESVPPWMRDVRATAVGLLNLASTPFGGDWGDRAASAMGEARDAVGEGIEWLGERGQDAGEWVGDRWDDAMDLGGTVLDKLSFWN
ncbi:MAG: hypothetical protein H6741_05035 [Alphaproteobacteria bacterium]|nr:hypothetical protein [Alphaproteobacteria bacterium]